MSTTDPVRPTILLFAKAPRAGTVKTRLAKDVGDERALEIYRWLGKRQLRAVPEGWPVVVYYAPADAEPEMRAWLGSEVSLEPQCEGDLGARLRRAVEQVFAGGARAAILVGTDCPSLWARQLENAAAMLRCRTDAVFGPTHDGGYYLLALRKPCPELFREIRWSTRHTLSDSLEAASRAGITTSLLPRHGDVDTLADLQREVDVGNVPAEIAGRQL